MDQRKMGDQQRGDESRLTAAMVERMLSREINALEQKVLDTNRRLEQCEHNYDEQVGELWKAVNKGISEIKDLLAKHAKEDTDALHEITTQVLMRVPAWALALITVGASLIGSMATYILDHLK